MEELQVLTGLLKDLLKIIEEYHPFPIDTHVVEYGGRKLELPLYKYVGDLEYLERTPILTNEGLVLYTNDIPDPIGDLEDGDDRCIYNGKIIETRALEAEKKTPDPEALPALEDDDDDDDEDELIAHNIYVDQKLSDTIISYGELALHTYMGKLYAFTLPFRFDRREILLYDEPSGKFKIDSKLTELYKNHKCYTTSRPSDIAHDFHESLPHGDYKYSVTGRPRGDCLTVRITSVIEEKKFSVDVGNAEYPSVNRNDDYCLLDVEYNKLYSILYIPLVTSVLGSDK